MIEKDTEVTIIPPGAKIGLIMKVIDRYEHNGEWRLVLKNQETGTVIRRFERDIEKPTKLLTKPAEGGKY